MRAGTLAACAATSLLFLAGCATLGGGPSVVNNQNQFSIAWSMNDHTESKSYVWKNDRQYARISFSTQLTAGTLNFKMLDQAGTAVCTIDFGTASTTSGVAVTKAAGQAGNWRVQFDLRKFSGNLGVSIEAADAPGTGPLTCL